MKKMSNELSIEELKHYLDDNFDTTFNYTEIKDSEVIEHLIKLDREKDSLIYLKFKLDGEVLERLSIEESLFKCSIEHIPVATKCHPCPFIKVNLIDNETGRVILNNQIMNEYVGLYADKS